MSRAESAPAPTSVLDASALLAVLYAEKGRPIVIDMVGLPEAWKTFEDGTPVPNWVALLHETRAER